MKERPILFSGEMVRAILEGRKTITRRIVKPQPKVCSEVTTIEKHENQNCNNWLAKINGATLGIVDMKCPYGQVGDRLCVKETFGYSNQADDINQKERVVVYRAGGANHVTDSGVDLLKRCQSGCLMQPNHYVRPPDVWKPSIFMPRWASRITLEIIDTRVETLQAITEADAIAEGVEFCGSMGTWEDYMNHSNTYSSARQSYASLWEKINGVDSWDANPWVWVIEFKKVEVAK
jgi:hypothetical protein